MARFQYDVFLSYSPSDKNVVNKVAEMLEGSGLRVWLDHWKIRKGQEASSKEEEGLEQSQTLLLFVSSTALDSHWPKLEASTLRFRDPLNTDRRFIPIRLDDIPLTGWLAELPYIDWRSDQRDQSWNKLLKACTSEGRESATTSSVKFEHLAKRATQIHYQSRIDAYSINLDGNSVLVGTNDTFQLCDAQTGKKLHEFRGHHRTVDSIAFSPSHYQALSGANDNEIRLWDIQHGECLKILHGHSGSIYSLAWSANGRFALSGSWDHTVKLWDLEAGNCCRTFEGHVDNVWSVAWTPDHKRLLSASGDKTVRLWDRETGRCLLTLKGHTGRIYAVTVGSDSKLALSGGEDKTLRLWDLETGRCLRVFEGHTGNILSLAWSSSHGLAISGSSDNTVRLWDVEAGRCLGVLTGCTSGVYFVSWLRDTRFVVGGEHAGCVRLWDISEFLTRLGFHSTEGSQSVPEQVQYTNAKVLLVGESGVGKTGLSKRLALDEWQPSDSTVGAWATHWKLPVSSSDGIEREIWLWDFGGQADQRLIHQLYMDETALAVLVFDGQKEDLFETLGQWDRDLTRASRQKFSKLLVARPRRCGGPST